MGNILLEGSSQLLQLAAKGGGVLMDEAIKLLIFMCVLNVLKTASVFIVLYIINRYLTFLDASNKSLKPYVKLAKTVSLIVSIMYFVVHSFPSLVELGKVTVAPNLYLVEKGITLIKKIKE